jgi:hypothetical protein
MNVQLFSFLLGHSFSALFPAVIPMEIESTWNLGLLLGGVEPYLPARRGASHG